MYRKGCIVWLLGVVCTFGVMAQGTGDSRKVSEPAKQQKAKVVYPLDWHMQSFSDGGLYGAEVYKAYEYLKDRECKRKVIVAVIDGGIDPNHEDLKENLWVNRGEIPGNKIDDDGNGYVDDVHGWNFLGMPDGTQVESLSLEADREFIRLQKQFDGVDTNKLSKKDLELYYLYDKKISILSPIGNAYKGIALAKLLVAYAEEFDREMKAKYPGVKLMLKHYLSIINKEEKNVMRNNAHCYYLMGWCGMKEASWQEIFDVRLKLEKDAHARYKKANCVELEQRGMVGDDLANIGDRYYGNNNLMSKNLNHGTHVAGIIGATRNNDMGMDGIADVELMILRVSVGKGDEYDKDVANAIRYAVENGANMINMSFGKPFSPNKKWVDDAMKLAERKGVLLLHAAGNNSESIDEMPVYPMGNLMNKKKLNNFITVGSIEANGNPAISSNYGKENTDLFAPGVDIYSTVGDNNYKKMGGTSMATPVVTGVAALIWNYFPELSVKELKQVLLEGTTSRKGCEVLKPQSRLLITKRVPVDFAGLSVTGGVLNAFKSVQLADEITRKNKKK